MIPGPVIQAMIGHALGRAFGPDEEEVQRADTPSTRGGAGDAAPSCAVCGGPLPDGGGCEYCPKAAA